MNKDEIWNTLSHYQNNYTIFGAEVRAELDLHLNNECDFYLRPSFTPDEKSILIFFKDKYLICFEFNCVKHETKYIPIKKIDGLIRYSESYFQINYGNDKILMNFPKSASYKFKTDLNKLFDYIYSLNK
jgi:hypothetical protein